MNYCATGRPYLSTSNTFQTSAEYMPVLCACQCNNYGCNNYGAVQNDLAEREAESSPTFPSIEGGPSNAGSARFRQADANPGGPTTVAPTVAIPIPHAQG